MPIHFKIENDLSKAVALHACRNNQGCKIFYMDNGDNRICLAFLSNIQKIVVHVNSTYRICYAPAVPTSTGCNPIGKKQ